MNGLAELFVANGGTLLTFSIFIGERIIQAVKDHSAVKRRSNDEIVRDYLEWFRQQDHALLLRTIEEKHEELMTRLAENSARLSEIVEKTLQLLNSDFTDLKTQVTALNKAIQRPVLSPIPLNCREITDVPLLSRDDDLAKLRQTINDLIISGQPGSGKTFLLYHLSKEWKAKFLISSNEEDILSYLRFSTPSVIIIDDAQDWLESIPRIIHFRRETGRAFRIIATCWPFEESDLIRVMQLGSHNLYRLSLLPANTIAQLVQGRFERAGYQVEKWLIREIREQAAGRPGLALRIADLLLLDGSLKSLKDGQVHFELIDRAFHHLEVIETRLTLASFAVGGKTGMRKENVSSVLGIPVHQISRGLRDLATGGVISETSRETLATIPDAFRHVLLRDEFLRGDATALNKQFWELYESAPNQEDALITLIGALVKGATVDECRLLDEMRKVNSIRAWQKLAWISSSWCNTVINECPDSIESLADPALHHIPERVIPLLLNLAVGDKRPENAHPEAPTRKLGDWINHYSLHVKDAFQRRQLLLNTTILWLRQGGNEEVAWRILPKTLSFYYENSEIDPGEGKAVTLTFGVVSLSDLEKIAELWMQIIQCVKEFPPSDWEGLKSAFHDWRYPFCPNAILPDGFSEFAREKVTKVIQQLIIQTDYPKNALIRWATEHDIEVEISADSEFIIFCPPESRGSSGNWQLVHKKYSEDAASLGKKWATQAPESVAEKLVLFERERRLFGINWPLLGHVICNSLANHITDLTHWIDIFMKYHVEADYLFPLIRRSIINKNTDTKRWLSLSLFIEEYRWHAISEILATDEIPEELFSKAWPYLGKYSNAIGTMALRADISIERLKALSEHDDKELLLEIAMHDFQSEKQPLLRSNKEIWLKMFRRAITDLKELNSKYFYNIEKLLECVPGIHYEIAEALLNSTEYISWAREKPYIKLFNSMPPDEKIRLLPLLEDKFPTDFTAWLVGDDLRVYRALLDNDKLHSHHLLPLMGKPSAISWQSKAILALDHGYQVHDVARAAIGNHWGWSGSAVTFWQDWVEEYNILLNSNDPRLQEVGQIGKEFPNDQLERAKKEEEHDVIYGMLGDE